MISQIQEDEKKEMNAADAISNAPPVGKILVVEDEPELKSILVESLFRQGYDAVGYSSGRQALAELQERNFDLLLTDLMMPEMDGIALLKAALEIDPHLIGIVMTGQGTIQTAVDAMKFGAFDYVLKPFRMQTLLPVLTRAMNVRHLRLENLQLRETVAIHGLCQTIAFTLDPQTVLSKLADAALQQSDADEVSILMPTSDESELYVAAVRGEKRERLLGERIPFEQSISSWVARERTPVILNGAVNDERFVALWPRSDIRSSISVPMQVANKLVGVINLNVTSRLRPFTLGQMKALTILASTAAAALESASLYGQLRRAEEKYRSIFENAIEGIFQSTPEGRFITVNPAMARILGYDSPEEVIEKITDVAHQIYVRPEARVDAARLQERFGFVQGFEFEAYRRDGEKIWLSLNRRSVCDDNGAEICREGSIEDITERKHAAEALRESEARKRAILESVLDCIVTMDHEGLIVDWNPAAERIFGYPREEAIGREMAELIIPPHLREHHRAGLANYLATGQGRVLGKRLELSAIRSDGAELPVELTITRIESEGAPMFTGYIRDITERKRAEDRLAAQHSVTRSLAEASTLKQGSLKVLQAICENLGWEYGALWTVDRGLAVLRCKEVWQGPATEASKFEKASRESVFAQGIGLPGRIWSEGQPLWIPDVVEHPNFPRGPIAVEEGLHAACGFPIRLGPEVLGVVEFFSRSIREPDSALLEMMATIGSQIGQFIERKRAEEALRDSGERYRELVENAHDIIYEHDLAGNYTSTNEAGERITGYSREETLKLNLTQTVAPEDLEKWQHMFRRKLAGETVTAYELDTIAKDGRRISLEVNSSLVFQNGVPVGVQGIARDVTERKQLEEQLRQSQKMEAIGQLAGGIAHDFNNLLTVIGGYSELLLRRLSPENPLRASAEEIKKASDRAGGLTRQLLAFSRKQILQPKVLDLNSVVSDLDKMLRRLIGEDIDLLTITEPALGQVRADPGQIEQVILNLAVNARDAISNGGQLTIQTSNVRLSEDYAQRHVAAVAGNYVMLAISDNGCGMDLGTKGRIFEPFFTTKAAGKGTGLGLSTVYGIVKQSGGNIWVYSEVGKGTTFKIYLPRVGDPSDGGFAHGDATPAPRGTETILLVEDEEQVRRIAHEILETQGYQVLVAVDGEEALAIGRRHEGEIDLMITDVVMPQMGGRESVERLSPLRPRMKVLYMSGYTDDAIVRHGLIDEQLQFIEKPFTADALARKVRTVLDSNAGTVA